MAPSEVSAFRRDSRACLTHPSDMFVKALFSPKTWPTFSAHLAAAMGSTSNGTGLLLGLQSNTAGEAGGDLSRFGAVCADAPRNASLTPEDYARSTLAALAVSKFTAGLIFTDVGTLQHRVECLLTTLQADGGCEYWPAEPIERFTGPFNATLSHPVLIVSNSVRGLVRFCCSGRSSRPARSGNIPRERDLHQRTYGHEQLHDHHPGRSWCAYSVACPSHHECS
jgi:hypothetical protein